MRIDLPACAFTPCKYYFDGNCMEKSEYERCDYRRLHDAEQDRPDPQPLTLEELREMDGEPVWCVDCFGNQCWAIVNAEDDDCIDKETGAWSMGLYGISDKPVDLTGWLAYRTKPEGSNT